MTARGAGRRATVVTAGDKPPPYARRVDLRALLAALVLLPNSYSRNRFYGLYRWPAARRVRRRAALLRSLLADLLAGRCALLEIERASAGAFVRYRTGLDCRRRTLVRADEIALLKAVLELRRDVRNGEAGPHARKTAVAAARVLAELAPLFRDTDRDARLGPLLARLLREHAPSVPCDTGART